MSMAAIAIGTSVVAIGGAATAAGMQASSASKAAKAQGAAAKKARRKEKKALEVFQKGQQQVEQAVADVPMPVLDFGADIRDAEQLTGYNIAQLERFYPGATSQRQLASMAISDLIKGIGPRSATEKTLRDIAEYGGAGFNINTAGKGFAPGVVQSTQANLARNLGQQSLDFTRLGLGASADWMRLSDQFIGKPLQVSQNRLAYQMGAANVGLQKAGIQADLVASLYGAQTGQAQRGYTRQLETVAANKAASDAVATGIGDVTGTVGQLGLSAYMAYNQIDAAKAADIASGAFNYEKAYGPATYGSAKPGWGNFDYGV
jgi:hypothetical protein